MFDLGRMQELKIQRINDSGALLVDPAAPLITLLLPGKQIPDGAGPGSMIRVFIYRDSEDRLIATTKQPTLTLGELAILPVISVSQIGAFLDWGLEKDLFLPFKEQRGRVKPGMKVLVALYIDKSSRLCATMNVYDYLSAESPYQQGDRVRGTVYGIQPEIGAFVAVDNRYFGLIPRQELHQRLSLGEEVEGRVIRLRPDGKLNISLQKKAYAQMKPDAEKVMGVIEEYGGVLPFTDKASPEVIEREMQMSKAAFKRAVGHLLKEKKIEITATAIRKL